MEAYHEFKTSSKPNERSLLETLDENGKTIKQNNFFGGEAGKK